MPTLYAPLHHPAVGAFLTVLAVSGTVCAQTTSTAAPKPVLSAPTSTARKAAPTSATPAMILEAIQRSQARSDKLRSNGKAEQFGSEEPFIFDAAR